MADHPLLYASTVVPIGGHTEFADQRAAYDALPEARKRQLEGLIAEHWIRHSRLRTGFSEFNEDEQKRLPPVPQLLVRTIPQNKRKSLFVASHAGRIYGMSDAEGRAQFNEYPHNIFFPGIFLAATVLAVNILGDGLRDTLDPNMPVTWSVEISDAARGSRAVALEGEPG